MSTVIQTITKRVRAKRRGWVFIPKDFLDIGTRAAVDQALSRLTKQGMIRRLDRGVYDFPKHHKRLGALSPNADDIAHAVSTKTGDRSFPSGATAANMLGLSTQVPAKPVYMTNGASRRKKIAGRTIVLKHAKVPIMNQISDQANLVLQALLYLGKDNIDDQVIVNCLKHLNTKDLNGLSNAASRVPSWMSDIIFQMKKQQI